MAVSYTHLMSMVIRPVYDPVKAGVLGITKASMMESVKSINDGLPVGVYRDNEKKVPVLLKSGNVDIADTPVSYTHLHFS